MPDFVRSVFPVIAAAFMALVLTSAPLHASGAVLPGSEPGARALLSIGVLRVQQGEGSRGSDSPDSGAATGSAQTTARAQRVGRQIAQEFERATAFCRKLADSAYAVDCIAYEYERIARSLPHSGEYSEVRKVLRDTAKKLRKLARDNQSTVKPEVRLKQGGAKPRATGRNIVPVRRDRLPQVAREAAVIINQGAGLLLRTTGDSDRLRAQYQQIARSMQTGATLLRSL